MEVYLVNEMTLRKMDDDERNGIIAVFDTYEKACKHAKKLEEENRDDSEFYYDYEIQQWKVD